MQLLGKLFVVFVELQLFSDKEWRAVDSELKDLITGAFLTKYNSTDACRNITTQKRMMIYYFIYLYNIYIREIGAFGRRIGAFGRRLANLYLVEFHQVVFGGF